MTELLSDTLGRKPFKDRFKDFVTTTVTKSTFIKATELPTLVSHFFEEGLTTESYTTWVEELVADGQILEVEYIVADMPYRVKSLFVSKDVLPLYVTDGISTSVPTKHELAFKLKESTKPQPIKK